ncbi:hypothetical protein YQE_09372, partial [Dendroctonus ponderosae]
MQSEYLKTFLLESPDVEERYKTKLGLINNVDPFTLNIRDLDNSIHGVPPVTNMDIVSYLVLTSYYTKEQMKCYKSLQWYKYLESGLIVDVGTKEVNGFFVLLGKVKHSLRPKAKPLEVWCIITKDEAISTAHCTCMAGSAEVCSHVGALLFAAEYANRRREEASCTDVLNAWMMPSGSSNI